MRNSFIKKITTPLTALILSTGLIQYTASAETTEPIVTAESVIMIDAETGIIIYEKNSEERLHPASTTKVMTALLLLEHTKSENKEITPEVFDKRITMSDYAIHSIGLESSNIAMKVGETLSLRESLYAIMLPSANEVSVAVAEFVAGSEEAFAAMMTARAKELGCENTKFKNAHGLTDPEHYTTAYDLSLILREAIKHDEFIDAISTRSYIIPPTEKQPLSRPIGNTNKLIQNGEFYYEYAIGGKTGYTDEARHTLVAYGEKEGHHLITAVMKAEKNMTYTDTISLMDYGFSCYSDINILTASSYSRDFTVTPPGNGGEGFTVNASPAKDLSLNLPETIDISKIDMNPIIDKTISLPIDKGDVIGVLSLSYNGRYLGSVELLSNAEVLPAEAVANNSSQSLTQPGTPEIENNQAQQVQGNITGTEENTKENPEEKAEGMVEENISIPASTPVDASAENNNQPDIGFYIMAFGILTFVSLFIAFRVYRLIFAKKNVSRSKYRVGRHLLK